VPRTAHRPSGDTAKLVSCAGSGPDGNVRNRVSRRCGTVGHAVHAATAPATVSAIIASSGHCRRHPDADGAITEGEDRPELVGEP
jgi:hypothetical protein